MAHLKTLIDKAKEAKFN